MISYIDTQKVIAKKNPPYTRIPVTEFIANPPYEPGYYATSIKGEWRLTPFSSPSLSQIGTDRDYDLKYIYLLKWIRFFCTSQNKKID